MNRLIEYLEHLDLTEIESKLYISLLKKGSTSIRELAKTAGVKRTTVYMYIDQLVEKGLIIKVVRGSRKLVEPNEPSNALKNLVEQKTKTAEEIKTQLPQIITRINTVFPQIKDVEEAEIKYYKGKNGVKKIYEDVLQAKEQRSYVDTTKIVEVFPENFQQFDKMLAIHPDAKMFEIFQNSIQEKTEAYLKHVTKHKNYSYKIFPKGVELTSQDILIYDNNVAIISFDDVISGVVLRNRYLYNNFRTLFDVMWRLLPENEK